MFCNIFFHTVQIREAQLPCHRPYQPVRVLVGELLEFSNDGVAQGVSPPLVLLPVCFEVLREASTRDTVKVL
jgi:hypothetical protein